MAAEAHGIDPPPCHRPRHASDGADGGQGMTPEDAFKNSCESITGPITKTISKQGILKVRPRRRGGGSGVARRAAATGGPFGARVGAGCWRLRRGVGAEPEERSRFGAEARLDALLAV